MQLVQIASKNLNPYTATSTNQAKTTLDNLRALSPLSKINPQ